jgi:hypothetical protein
VAVFVTLLPAAAFGAFTSVPAGTSMSVSTTTLAAPTLTCDSVVVLTVNLHWTSSQGATGYALYRRLNTGGYSLLTSLGLVLGLSTSIPPLLSTYHYRVQATNNLWTSPNSNTVSAGTVTCG